MKASLQSRLPDLDVHADLLAQALVSCAVVLRSPGGFWASESVQNQVVLSVFRLVLRDRFELMLPANGWPSRRVWVMEESHAHHLQKTLSANSSGTEL